MSAENPYYDPEAFGFTQIALAQDDTLSYEFDVLVVWREDATGYIYAAADAGCSCPTPFEDADVQRLNTMADFDALASSSAGWSYADIQKARRAVAEHLL